MARSLPPSSSSAARAEVRSVLDLDRRAVLTFPLGTRFRPLSLDAPKPLFPIAGRPIIWHHLEALSKVQSVKEVLLIGFYEEHVFRVFIREAEAAFPSFTIK